MAVEPWVLFLVINTYWWQQLKLPRLILKVRPISLASCSNLNGGPFWRVPTGRRDGTISRSSEALNNIPPPTSNFTNLQRLFANQGLDLKDLVLLSGTALKENATP
ncbi:hypothetical protein NC653_019499 [Populus alba x Populus x berolinensis]|uniref:peroxidase n=1 Tax=Populus alba x Populus x berolinensis TaxID=444605 RepID=A0AAD6VXG9_9ROSI|nr:hypothetical protein NC653_019499 [Populus alba x Populus x berolinensis]